MTELRTLGRIEFAGPGSERAAALLVQPKRLALLIYLLLGVASEGGLRQGVVDLFWPEADRDRGRGSLRNALYFLRRHLGPGAISKHGALVLVEPAEVRCDAVAFDKLIAEGRHAEALALYGGDLVPGLVVSDSPGFVTWLEGERERLRLAAAGAAWALAEEEEGRGNWISATDLARRAAALDGDREHSVRRLMRLLDRAGDRVAALHEYESFKLRWARELDLAPSPRTVALAESIRAGSLDPEPTEEAIRSGHRRGAPASRRSRKIAVLPFGLSGGGGGYEHLAVALAHELIDSLNRLSEIMVVARESVDRYRVRNGRSVGQIAEELRADSVLDGSLRVLEDRLVVVARLVEARTGTPLWAEVYEALPSEVDSVQTRLVLDLLDTLRIRPSPEQAEHLARSPTTAPEAYALYLEGRSRWSRRSQSDAETATRLFERALEIDPDFARAWAGLADAYLLLHPAAGVRSSEARVRAREAARAALRLDPRLGEAHATLGLLRVLLEQDWQGGEEELRLAVELSPGLATAHHWLGAFLAYVRRRFDQAIYELALALQLDPLSPMIHCDLGMALFNSGRRREGLVELREALEIEPDLWRGHYDLGIASFVCGDPVEGTAHLERAWALGAWGAKPLPDAAGADGFWRDRLARKLDALGAGPRHRAGRAFEAATVSMLLDLRDDALGWLRVAAREGQWGWVMQYYPLFDALHDNPDFVRLLQEAGLASSREHPDPGNASAPTAPGGEC